VALNDRRHRVTGSGIADAAVGVDLADAQAGGSVPLGEQLAPAEEAVVAELESRDRPVTVEVEQEVAGVALAVADVRQGEAVGIGLPEIARVDSVPGHDGAPTPPRDPRPAARERDDRRGCVAAPTVQATAHHTREDARIQVPVPTLSKTRQMSPRKGEASRGLEVARGECVSCGGLSALLVQRFGMVQGLEGTDS